ncbi:MAG: queuosine precursor transporter [Anaerovoracaceae bacterium]|jgi:uncharacterized integral membrane protein (TIGR00697 family)
MSNEWILILTLVLEFAGVVLCYRLFGRVGLYLWTVMATITANIEVLLLVRAFGMEMTLGNVLFASTFLVTDILSELYSKKAARRAVSLGIATSVIFVLISWSWLYYTPAADDFAAPAIRQIFSHTPRLMISSIAVYVVVQYFDVWLYHKWWALTERRSRSRRGFLWLRNNGSTLVSQLLNSVLYPLAAFYGVYSMSTLLSIMLSSYVIFIVTSLADTPFLYLSRYLRERRRGVSLTAGPGRE